MEELVNEILEYLFEKYKLIGAERIDMNEFITSKGTKPNDLAIRMNKRGLIRFYQFNQGFVAAISRMGINNVAPNYFEEEANKVLLFAKENDNKTTVSTALQIPENHYEKALDIADYISKKKLAAVQIANSDARIYLL